MYGFDDYSYTVKRDAGANTFTATCVEIPECTATEYLMNDAMMACRTEVAKFIDRHKTSFNIPVPFSDRQESFMDMNRKINNAFLQQLREKEEEIKKLQEEKESRIEMIRESIRYDRKAKHLNEQKIQRLQEEISEFKHVVSILTKGYFGSLAANSDKAVEIKRLEDIISEIRSFKGNEIDNLKKAIDINNDTIDFLNKSISEHVAEKDVLKEDARKFGNSLMQIANLLRLDGIIN